MGVFSEDCFRIIFEVRWVGVVFCVCCAPAFFYFFLFLFPCFYMLSWFSIGCFLAKLLSSILVICRYFFFTHHIQLDPLFFSWRTALMHWIGILLQVP